MARTVNEILHEMIAAKEVEPKLNELNSNSKTSIWRLLFYIFAVTIHTLEVLLDAFKLDVEVVIEANRPGVLSWYTQKAKAFQIDSLINSMTLAYDIIDAEKQIVAYAAAEENVNGGITLKLSKKDAPLTDSELLKFKTYMEKVKYAGVAISYVSIAPDTLTIDMQVFYNPLASESSVRALIEVEIAKYLNNIGFNGLFKVNDLIVGLRSVAEVSDIKIGQIEVDSVIIGVSHVAKSGRFVYNSGNSTIQLTPQAL